MYTTSSLSAAAPNSLKPFSARRLAIVPAKLAQINSNANAAQDAVLGYCTDPNTPGVSANVAAEIASSPNPQSVVQAMTNAPTNVSAGTAATGTSTSSRCWSNKPIQTVSMQGTVPAMPAPPPLVLPSMPPVQLPSAPATTQVAPVVPAAVSVVQAPVPSIASYRHYQVYHQGAFQTRGPGFGDYPPWGDQFQNPAAAGAGTQANWLTKNPGLVTAAALFVAAILFGKK